MKHLFPAFLIFLWLLSDAVFAISVAASERDLGGSVLRDYPVALTSPRGRLEVSIDYQTITSGLDAFDLRAEQSDAAQDAQRWMGPGDLHGGRLLLNYGVFDRTTLTGAATYQDMNAGADALGVRIFEFGVKQSLINKRNPRVPKLALDAGFKIDEAADSLLGTQASAESGGSRISLRDPSDWTASVRLTAGQIWGRFFPNIFMEYGHTRIDGTGALVLSLPDQSGGGEEFPVDFSRSEDYFKTGLSMLVKFPYKALLHLEYDYLHLFRGGALDAADYNHIFKAELNYYLTSALVIDFGGVYFHRQLNGQIPFLYNQFTQSGFDRDYGYFYIGMTCIFGGGHSKSAELESKVQSL